MGCSALEQYADNDVRNPNGGLEGAPSPGFYRVPFKLKSLPDSYRHDYEKDAWHSSSAMTQKVTEGSIIMRSLRSFRLTKKWMGTKGGEGDAGQSGEWSPSVQLIYKFYSQSNNQSEGNDTRR